MTQELTLASGYRVEAQTSREETVSIHAPDGRLCLKITLTEAGPLVELSSVALSIKAQSEIRLDCERLEINAQKQLELRSGDRLSLYAEGDLRSEAFSQRIIARRGDVAVKANDDVMLDGERIRLNSPRTSG